MKYGPGKIIVSNFQVFIILGIMAGFLSFSSCDFFGGPTRNDAVAKVYNQYLYRSDLQHLVPPYTSAADSALLVDRFIQNWIKQQVMVREAMNDLPSEKRDFEKQIQDYRNSLIIYAWENYQVLNNLDTVISNREINEFFEQNQSSFLLKESIAKVRYIKVPVEAPDAAVASRLIRAQDQKSLAELEEYCIQHAANYLLDNDSWLVFNDLLREVPIRSDSPENILSGNRIIELSDDFYRYYVRILDFKLKGSTAPLAFERDNIREILINKRKLQFLSQLRNQLYNDALNNKKAEVFY